LLFTFRYLRLLISIYAYLTTHPKAISPNPKFAPGDVTVLIPTTFKSPPELLSCLRRITSNRPSKIVVITSHTHVQSIRTLCTENILKATVLGVAILNKRTQLLRGLEFVQTPIVVLADDDVLWPSQNYLSILLTIFENEEVGAGGGRQRLKRKARPSFWDFLGTSYLERRVWNNISTNRIDGSISTLSGRTAAYRSCILKNPWFYNYFANDFWKGRLLNSDDDKCLTRWVFRNGWDIAIQTHEDAVLETTLETGWGFIQQCLRWARAHWRGNLIVMEGEKYWCERKYWFGLYAIYIAQWTQFAVVYDGVMLALVRVLWPEMTWGFVGWVLGTKLVKLVPHFWRYPKDLVLVPVSVAFSYLHGVINLYALLTLRTMNWSGK
ncbi:glycosyltransferase family 2 protein, partial [Piedraia hortae CBS 480.64]